MALGTCIHTLISEHLFAVYMIKIIIHDEQDLQVIAETIDMFQSIVEEYVRREKLK